MSRPQPVKLGPFTGGLNTYSDPSSIEENELVECLNMELDLDGSLVCRPIIRKLDVTKGNWATRLKIIGQGVWGSEQVLFGSSPEGLYKLNSITGPWVKITTSPNNNVEYRDAVQIGGVVAFIPASAGNGGYWSPSTGWINDSNMPTGNAGVFHKARLWITPGPNDPSGTDSYLWYSGILVGLISGSNKLTWPGTNQIGINLGDGQSLVDVVVYLDQLLLFKTDSTFVLAYETTLDQALVRCIHTEVGATTRVNVAVWEDFVYVFHQGKVYEIKNYQFEEVNDKVPFEFDLTEPIINSVQQVRQNNAFICVVEDRLVVRFYNRVYLFNLLTRTWSRWESPEVHLHNFGYLRPFPTNSLRDKPRHYIAGSVLRDQTDIFEWVEGRAVDTFETYDGITREQISCYIVTKTIDMDDPFNFKRLMWWGADVLSAGPIAAIARPIVVSWGRTWHSLEFIPWDDLLTWDHPTDTPYFEETSVVDDSVVGRKFIKLNKSLRFRQIYFTLLLPSDGSTQDGPSRVFSVVPWVGQKQVVVKQVS